MKPVWLILFSGFTVLSAQQLPVQVSAGAGYATFIDESDQSHATAGGSARFYFSRRNAIEPEVLYLYRDASDKDLLLQVNYVRDLGPSTGKAVPYLIGGAGYIWGLRSRFTERSATASGGFGVRVFLSERFFVSPEVRLGAEPIFRLQLSFGWTSNRP